jgi:quercetin dioxygenase-like cupin family protein
MDQPAHAAAIDADTAALLAAGLAPIEPPARVRARLRERLLGQSAPAGLITIAADAGQWQVIAPGIARKVLLRQGGTLAFLLRLEAGAVIPAHDHPADEECMVLEGEVEIDGALVRHGAFHFAPRGLAHTTITARTAALLYLRTAA